MSAMVRIVILGSGIAVAAEDQANTHLAIIGARQSVLIDCPGAALPQLQRAAVDLDSLSDLILTHFHPDHAAGLPGFLMSLWLLGRTQPLAIHGLAPVTERAQALMELFEWHEWPDMYAVAFNPIPQSEGAHVLRTEEFDIQASPTRHMTPSIALRVRTWPSGRVAVYSSDTEPCDDVVRMAQGAQILIHEATGEGTGHSSPAEAAGVAQRARAEHLFLIHYSLRETSEEELLAAAAGVYSGPVDLARDLMSISI
jgi:ribonuclease Z